MICNSGTSEASTTSSTTDFEGKYLRSSQVDHLQRAQVGTRQRMRGASVCCKSLKVLFAGDHLADRVYGDSTGLLIYEGYNWFSVMRTGAVNAASRSAYAEFGNTKVIVSMWINLKLPFQKVFGGVCCNLEEAVKLAGLTWEGRAHCGLDDAMNTARLLTHLKNPGFRFSITNLLVEQSIHTPSTLHQPLPVIYCPSPCRPSFYLLLLWGQE